MFSFYLSYDNYIIIVSYNQVKKHREENKKSPCRYRYDGDILKGIVQYLEIINHMKKRDNQWK